MANLAEQRNAHIKPENIGSYELSKKLGGTTLTPEEAYALLDMEPEQVKERVKTAADVLMLMLAGQYRDCQGDRNVMIDGQEWHYNLNAFQVMQTRTTNCGSAANLANYLLEGDYEEIGFILHAYYIGNGGGHVYNYFKYQGKYYLFYHSLFPQKSLGTYGGFRSLCVNEASVNEDTVTIEKVSATKEGVAQIKNLDPYQPVNASTIAACSNISYEQSDEGC